MTKRRNLKIYTLRHFLFYMGVICIISMIVIAASEVLDLSYGLSVAILIGAGLLVPTVALRESLFAPAEKSRQRHSKHV